MCIAGFRSCLLDRAISTDDLLTEFRHLRTAASGSSHLGFDERLTKNVVDFIHQQPGPPIRHAHFLARSRDRAVLCDKLQQLNFARSKKAERAKINTNRK